MNALRPRLTISVLTKDEEPNIERCLRSAAFADEIVVIDGGSADATVELARGCNAMVFQYDDWQGFAAQRNRQLAHANGEYLLLLDADEEITPQLRQEITALLEDAPSKVYGLLMLEVAFGRELTHAAPHKAHLRLFRRDCLKCFEGEVHEKPIFTSRQIHGGFLQHYARHYSKTSVHVALKKLTQYASLGAYKRRKKGQRGGVLRGLLAGLSAFVSAYIFKRAFTGGGAGFLYSFFLALEAFFRYAALKYDDLKNANATTR